MLVLVLLRSAAKLDVNNQIYLDLDHINRPTITQSLQGVSPQ